MHQATSFSPTSGTSSESSDSAFVGFDMAYGGNLWDWGSAKIGWDFGFGLLPISITDNLSHVMGTSTRMSMLLIPPAFPAVSSRRRVIGAAPAVPGASTRSSPPRSTRTDQVPGDHHRFAQAGRDALHLPAGAIGVLGFERISWLVSRRRPGPRHRVGKPAIQ